MTTKGSMFMHILSLLFCVVINQMIEIRRMSYNYTGPIFYWSQNTKVKADLDDEINKKQIRKQMSE